MIRFDEEWVELVVLGRPARPEGPLEVSTYPLIFKFGSDICVESADKCFFYHDTSDPSRNELAYLEDSYSSAANLNFRVIEDDQK